ncbi:MAG: hypothetical protein ACJZ64_02285 [Opitutales bacterium]
MQQNKLHSLEWAIDELSKQKEDLASKLTVAQKREETSSLINEVVAQKKALNKRISSLEEGLKASTEFVIEPVLTIEDELKKVNEKIEIAKDRLNNLEQEKYLEELGRKLNGEQLSNSDLVENSEPESMDALNVPSEQFTSENINQSSENFGANKDSPQTLPTANTVLMKPSTNRIEIRKDITEGEVTNRPPISETTLKSLNLEQCSSSSIQNLEECANALGIEPEFLLNKGLQAVLRMIGRNGNKISFPLEVEQVENS